MQGKDEVRAAYLSSQMLQILVVDREVTGEHAGGDLATIGAVAHKDVNQARTFGGEGKLYCAAKASRSSFRLFAVAIVCNATEGEVWLISRSVADRHSGSQMVWRLEKAEFGDMVSMKIGEELQRYSLLL